MHGFRECPIRVLEISIGVQGPFRVWDTHIKEPAGSEYAVCFRKEMAHFFVKLKVFEHVFAIDMSDSVVSKRPLLS
jgi:hypothetical protein